MTYFLDTNICIYYLKNSFPKLNKQLQKTPFAKIKLPSMVAAELLFGAEKSKKRDYNLKLMRAFISLFEVISFDIKAADHYAIIRAELENKGQVIGGNDLIIAAITLANNGTLITHNEKEFSRIKNLKTDDWC